jgi:hypothetical protein
VTAEGVTVYRPNPDRHPASGSGRASTPTPSATCAPATCTRSSRVLPARGGIGRSHGAPDAAAPEDYEREHCRTLCVTGASRTPRRRVGVGARTPPPWRLLRSVTDSVVPAGAEFARAESERLAIVLCSLGTTCRTSGSGRQAGARAPARCGRWVEAGWLAVHPAVSPGRVLRRQAQHQVAELLAGWLAGGRPGRRG